MRLQHGKAIRKDDRLKFQKRSGDLHDFLFTRMISHMLKRAKEKLQEKTEDSQDDGIEETSSDGESDLANDSSEEEVNMADMALPKNMKVVVESSDESD